MLILKPIILQKAVSTVIAPHGITDLIHANQHNITSELLQINGFTLVYIVMSYILLIKMFWLQYFCYPQLFIFVTICPEFLEYLVLFGFFIDFSLASAYNIAFSISWFSSCS